MTINNIDEGVQYWVEVKRFMNDPWQIASYLVPEEFSTEVAPSIGRAVFSHHAGMIKREDGTEYYPYSGYDLTGWYCRITTRYSTNDFEVRYIGKIVDRRDILLDSAGFVFDQVYTAFELTYDLDRIPVDRFLARNPFNVLLPHPIAGLTPTFNKKNEFGGKLTGNRSTAKTGGPPFVNCHFFDDRADAKVWSALDVLTYIVEFLLKDPAGAIADYFFVAPEFSGKTFLTGQYQALAGVYRVWDFSEKTVFAALNEVINRSAGFVWNLVHLENASSGQTLFQINVRSVSTTPITIGAASIPANNDVNILFLPTDFPFTHLVEGLDARVSDTSSYGSVEVIGGPISVTTTWRVDSNLELVPAWDQSKETDYRDAGGGDEEEQDRERANEKYDGFYTKFVLKENWDGTITGTQGDKVYILPKVNPLTGEITFPQETQRFWPGNKSFEREISLAAGYDYTTNPPTWLGAASLLDEMLPMIAFIRDVTDGDLHDATELYVPVDRIAEFIPDLGMSFSVRPLDKQIGFEIGASPRHLFALPVWDDEDDETKTYPEFAWGTLFVTATLKTDTRLRKIATLNPNAQRKKLTIHVPDAEVWAVLPTTIVSGSASTTPNYYNGSLFVRDDRPILDGIAAAAASWHTVPKQSISISIKRVSAFGVRLGQLLSSVVGLAANVGVNSVITAIRTDIRGGRTQIETNWGDQDFAPDFASFFQGQGGGSV